MHTLTIFLSLEISKGNDLRSSFTTWFVSWEWRPVHRYQRRDTNAGTLLRAFQTRTQCQCRSNSLVPRASVVSRFINPANNLGERSFTTGTCTFSSFIFKTKHTVRMKSSISSSHTANIHSAIFLVWVIYQEIFARTTFKIVQHYSKQSYEAEEKFTRDNKVQSFS